MSFVIEYAVVKEYIEQHFGRLKEYVIERNNIEKSTYDINFVYSDNLCSYDENGWACSKIKVFGRYTVHKENIEFNINELLKRLNDIKQGIYRGKYILSHNMYFGYVDMTILHDLAHAYQHKILKKL